MAKSKTEAFVLCPKRGDECDIDSCPRYLVNVEITSSRGRRTANGFCLERGSRYITGVTEDYFRDRESASTQPFYERDAKDYAERIGRIRKSVEGELFYVGHHLFDDKPKGDDGDLFDTVSDAIEYHIGQMIAGKPIAPKVGSDWSKAIPDMLSFPDDEALYRVTEHPDEHPEAEDVTLPDGTKAHVVSHLQAHPIKPHVDRVKEMTRRYLEKGLEIARFLNSDSKSAWSRALGDYERVKGAFAMPESRSVLDDMVSAMTEAATQLSVDLNIPDESKKVRDRETAAAVAEVDALCSLAAVAVKNNYCCPVVDDSGVIEIHDGRHAVVEQMQKTALFVPNDTYMGKKEDRVAIITGPNMAGKSTYMRQTALIVLMAQMGSFVPAKSAVIGVIDRVFTRIGASDDLAAGQSTFMLEMSEMANILQYATGKSLLILDEIGRGTSTYDGMAIARAVLEYCADKRKLGAKTMFATHYHELSALEGAIPGVHNYNISAKKQGGTLVFLRKIMPGSADDSYGIEVAKLAGVPDSVITKAKTYLKELEANKAEIELSGKAVESDQISLIDVGTDEVGRILRSTDVNSLTPIEALNLLCELQKKAKG